MKGCVERTQPFTNTLVQRICPFGDKINCLILSLTAPITNCTGWDHPVKGRSYGRPYWQAPFHNSYFHRDNTILCIGHPRSPSDHQTSVDGFFLHRVRPLEMVSSWPYATLSLLYPNINTKQLNFPLIFIRQNVAGVNVDKCRRRVGSEICCSAAWNVSHVNLMTLSFCSIMS